MFMRFLTLVVAAFLVPGCKSSAPHDRSTPSRPAASSPVIRSGSLPPRTATVTKVQSIVAKVLGLAPADVPPATALSKLPKPIDDLDMVEIVLELEEQFHIDIADDALVRAAGGESSMGLDGGLTVEKLTGLRQGLTVEKLADLVESRSR